MSLSTEYRVNKVRPPGSLASLVTRAVREIGTPKDLAGRIKKSAQSIVGYTDPDSPVTRFPYAVAQTMTELGSLAFIDDLANRAGVAVVRMSSGDTAFNELMVRCTKEYADAISAGIESECQVGTIPRAKAMRLMGEFQDLIGAAAQIIACIASRMEQSESGGSGQ